MLKYLLVAMLVFTNAVYAQNPVLGVKLVDMHGGKILFENNSNLPLLPASNQKIITLYSAMKTLPKDFAFKTEFAHDGAIKNGILNGNLYIKFSGDPTLKSSDVSEAITKLKELGVAKIKGKIVIDSVSYEDEDFAPGWGADQLIFCHHAPIGSIIIDQNCQKATLSVRNKKLSIEPNSALKHLYLYIENKAQFDEGANECNLKLKHRALNQYRLESGYNSKCDNLKLSIAIRDPKTYAAKVLSLMLKDFGVEYNMMSFKSSPKNAKVFYTVASQSLDNLLYVMMRDSDNLIAESVFRKISETDEESGSIEKSAKITTNMFANSFASNFRIADGSGASRKNFVSAGDLVNLLTGAYLDADADFAARFVKSFPIMGREGTLKKFNNIPAEFEIYAKTGTMENVSALSGYIFHKNKRYAFSIIQNAKNDQDPSTHEQILALLRIIA